MSTKNNECKKVNSKKKVVKNLGVKLKNSEEENNKDKKYLRKYSFLNLTIIFYIFCFFGWLWELVFQLIRHFRIVNRGFLHGPWLPIYGVSGLIILIFLYKARKKPVLNFTLVVLICGTVEYITSYVLEKFYNLKWWDYSNYFLNLNGRIFALGLLGFGLAAMIAIYIVAPKLDELLSKIPKKILIIISIILSILFLIDIIYSFNNPNEGKGVSYDKVTYGQLKIPERRKL